MTASSQPSPWSQGSSERISPSGSFSSSASPTSSLMASQWGKQLSLPPLLRGGRRARRSSGSGAPRRGDRGRLHYRRDNPARRLPRPHSRRRPLRSRGGANPLATLFAVGASRTLVTRLGWMRSGLEMLLVGTLAAAVAYGIGGARVGAHLTRLRRPSRDEEAGDREVRQRNLEKGSLCSTGPPQRRGGGPAGPSGPSQRPQGGAAAICGPRFGVATQSGTPPPGGGF